MKSIEIGIIENREPFECAICSIDHLSKPTLYKCSKCPQQMCDTCFIKYIKKNTVCAFCREPLVILDKYIEEQNIREEHNINIIINNHITLRYTIVGFFIIIPLFMFIGFITYGIIIISYINKHSSDHLTNYTKI